MSAAAACSPADPPARDAAPDQVAEDAHDEETALPTDASDVEVSGADAAGDASTRRDTPEVDRAEGGDVPNATDANDAADVTDATFGPSPYPSQRRARPVGDVNGDGFDDALLDNADGLFALHLGGPAGLQFAPGYPPCAPGSPASTTTTATGTATGSTTTPTTASTSSGSTSAAPAG